MRLTEVVNVDELLDNKPLGDPMLHLMRAERWNRRAEQEREERLIAGLVKPTTNTNANTCEGDALFQRLVDAYVAGFEERNSGDLDTPVMMEVARFYALNVLGRD
jgi:hypothetical protein